jgi:hypothetical protein
MNPHAANQIVIQDDKNETKNNHDFIDLYNMSRCRSEDSIREKTAPNIPRNTGYHGCLQIYLILFTTLHTTSYSRVDLQYGIERRN